MALTIDGSDPTGDLGDLLDAKRDASLPVGKVLQVVYASATAEVTSTSATYTDTGLTGSITLSSTSSKVLVMISQTGYANPSSDETRLGLRIVRGATTLFTNVRAVGLNQTGGSVMASVSLTYLDEPASTSALTYKTQLARAGGAGNVSVQPGSAGPSTMILIEVAA